MNEFQPQPADNTPPAQPSAPPPPPEQGFLSRPLIVGLSLPWLVGVVLLLAGAAWYLFWPAASETDLNDRAFGQAEMSGSFQPVVRAPQPAAAPLTASPLVATAGDTPAVAGSVPDDVVKLIREGQAFESANREAITRLADTVRAQNAALESLRRQLDGQTSENMAMKNRLFALESRQTAGTSASAKTTHRASRGSALSGMRLESVQGGMAWVSWQGRTWAVQAGDRLGPLTIRDVSATDRQVLTSAGVLQ